MEHKWLQGRTFSSVRRFRSGSGTSLRSGAPAIVALADKLMSTLAEVMLRTPELEVGDLVAHLSNLCASITSAWKALQVRMAMCTDAAAIIACSGPVDLCSSARVETDAVLSRRGRTKTRSRDSISLSDRSCEFWSICPSCSTQASILNIEGQCNSGTTCSNSLCISDPPIGARLHLFLYLRGYHALRPAVREPRVIPCHVLQPPCEFCKQRGPEPSNSAHLRDVGH